MNLAGWLYDVKYSFMPVKFRQKLGRKLIPYNLVAGISLQDEKANLMIFKDYYLYSEIICFVLIYCSDQVKSRYQGDFSNVSMWQANYTKTWWQLISAGSQSQQTSLHPMLKLKTKQKMSQPMRFWYLSHMRPVKAQASLCIRAVWPEPSLFAHIN